MFEKILKKVEILIEEVMFLAEPPIPVVDATPIEVKKKAEKDNGNKSGTTKELRT